MTAHQYEGERNRTSLITAVSIGVILLVSLYFGNLILNAFSISLSSFRVAGGILIVSIAMTMISGKLGEHKQNKEEKNEDITEYEISVCAISNADYGRTRGNWLNHCVGNPLPYLGRLCWL